MLVSAAPDSFKAKDFNCLLALTDRRLLFVAPAPQVLSWPLGAVTRVQILQGSAGQITTFFVDDSNGGQYQLGADGQWGQVFVTNAKRAIAEAILRNT